MLTKQDIEALRVAKVGEVVETSEGKMVAPRAATPVLCGGCGTCAFSGKCGRYGYRACVTTFREDKKAVYFEKVEATK